MLLGPIFQVELVTAARRRRYFLLRVLYAVVILFVLWVTYESAIRWQYSSGQPSIQQVATAAASFFISFSWVQLLGLLAVAPAMAVGTISTERERRTIEYLFATDLSNSEIVLGKTFARLTLICSFVLAGLPILYIFRLLGGIPASMLAASFLISASTAVFLTALSVCISVWSAKARDATIRVYLALVALLFLPLVFWPFGFMLGGTQIWQRIVGPIVAQASRINPIRTLIESLGQSAAVGANLDFAPIWDMVLWHGVLSVGFVGLATVAIRRVHLRESTRGAKTEKKSTRKLREQLPTVLRPRRRIGNYPMIWKEMFAGTSKTSLGWVGSIAVLLIVLTMVGLTLWMFIESIQGGYGSDQYPEFVMGITGFAAPAALLIIAARASGLISQEKERDTWLSLMATPLTGREIVFGKALGNLYYARWALALLAFTWVLAVLFDVVFVVTICFLLATFIVCASFVTALGLLFSLRSKTSMRAMGLTLGTAIFVGGGYLFCCCSVFALGGGSGPDESILIGLAPCIPFLMLYPVQFYNWFIVDGGKPYVGDEFFPMTLAYIMGVIGYTAMAAILFFAMTQDFDRWTGRTLERSDEPRPQS